MRVRVRVWGGRGGAIYRVLCATDVLCPQCCLCLCATCTEGLDPWCSGLPLQEVSNVSETSHRRCSLMERDELVERRLQ